MSKGSPFRGTSRFAFATLLVAGALIAAVSVLALERIGYERREAIEQATRKNRSLAIAYEQHTIRTVQALDQAVRFVRHEYLDHGARLDLAQHPDFLDRTVLIYAGVVSERGIAVIESTVGRPMVDVSDREYFAFHRDHAVDELRIGVPTVSRVAGQPGIQATRRISGPAGEFRGVALVAMSPSQLAAFEEHADLGAQGVLQFVGMDGFARVRKHGTVVSFGDDMRDSQLLRLAARAPAGDFTTRGSTDGVVRLQSYRLVAGYPFVVGVGSSLEEALSGFHARRRDYLAAAAAATLFVLALAATLLVADRRQRALAAELSERERRFRNLLGSVKLVSVMLDREGNVTYCNDHLLELTGWIREQVIGRNWFDLFVPPELQRVRRDFASVLSDQPQTSHYENEILDRRGGRRLIRWHNSVLRSASGEVIGTASVGEDITEQKAAERELREQLEELRRFQAVTIDRELRMVELKREVRELRERVKA